MVIEVLFLVGPTRFRYTLYASSWQHVSLLQPGSGYVNWTLDHLVVWLYVSVIPGLATLGYVAIMTYHNIIMEPIISYTLLLFCLSAYSGCCDYFHEAIMILCSLLRVYTAAERMTDYDKHPPAQTVFSEHPAPFV